MTSFWCLYFQLWTYFTPCSSVSTVNFEHVNADWEPSYLIKRVMIKLHKVTLHRIKIAEITDNICIKYTTSFLLNKLLNRLKTKKKNRIILRLLILLKLLTFFLYLTGWIIHGSVFTFVLCFYFIAPQFRITLSVGFYISYSPLESTYSINFFSTNSAHFLDPKVIPAKTEVYKFISGILTSNVKVIMWSHKRHYQKSVPVLPPDGH